MKKSLLTLAVTLVICSISFLGCIKPEISSLNNSTSNQFVSNRQILEVSNVKVDLPLQNVASNFQKKLEYYNGNLISLTLINGNINAEWNSRKCDWFKEEIIDLEISINRGYTNPIKGINARRICDSDMRKFSTSGDEFEKYKSGRISDSQFTKAIK
ncbi:MAG: hypothetical protein LC768_02310 [Acidobacteria bacterium]|nr:hypothetical protein [Acidobacteriota bacterium]MCA1637165.1 hypothetical protein [Acidobacteriota bacterium]